MNALVTGASGFIGSALVERLAASGERVTALTRRAGRVFPPNVTPWIGDLATGAGISAELVRDVDVVFNCAGETQDAAAMAAVHVQGMRILLGRVLERGSPAHWVQLSSVGAYGPPSRPDAARTITESSPEAPRGPYETSKTEGDRLIRGVRSPMTWTILRPSNVIGARMPNASVRGLLAAVRRGWYFHIGRPGAIATYVHVEDVVSALMACANDPRARGQVFNLSNDCPLDAVIARAAGSLGVSPPRLRLNESLVRTVVRAISPVVSVPLTSSRVDALVARTAYPSTRIESMLGFHFTRPLPDAVDDVVSSLA